jgi:D-alanine transaminase
MTRQLILRLVGRLGIPFVGSHVTLPELKSADEVILVGTTSEVVPIIQIDDAPVGAGTPGPIARRLWDAYRQDVEGWLAGGFGCRH